jgi:hypothetical protein
MNHRMRPGGAPSTTPVFIAYIDPARFLLNEDRPQWALLGVRGHGSAGSIQKIIWISDYCGGLMASIPERENNNPSGMFKRIHVAAIIMATSD